MNALLEAIHADIASRQLIHPGGRILIAVSGGVDSMVLLDLLRRLARRSRWSLGVAHFNHQLRGDESNQDAGLVRAVAEDFGLPFLGGEGNVRQIARRSAVSTEMAARTLRHRFLADIARRGAWDFVATAHHADDQVELFFLRLLRGSGPEGLSGMPWSGPSPADPRITLIRPLLGVDRASIARYARDHRIRFREDRSNDDTRILRNRIRHCLVPLLARDFQPAFSTVILRTMEILRAESEVVEKLARRHASRKGRRGFDKLPLALKRRIVVNELLRLGLATPFDLVDQLIREPARPVQVSPKVRLRLLADGALRKIKSKSGDFDLAEQFIPLNGKSGTARFGQVDFRWRIRTGPPAVEIPGAAARPGHEWFDAAALGRGIRLRHWRPGDRFQPIGAGSPRKLQDLFVNLKVSKALRHQRIVAEGFDGTLFWVEGMRIGDSAKVTSKTARYLHWEWRCAKGP